MVWLILTMPPRCFAVIGETCTTVFRINNRLCNPSNTSVHVNCSMIGMQNQIALDEIMVHINFVGTDTNSDDDLLKYFDTAVYTLVYYVLHGGYRVATTLAQNCLSELSELCNI